MKTILSCSGTLSLAACLLLAGCGQSSPTPGDAANNTSAPSAPSTPAPSSPVVPAPASASAPAAVPASVSAPAAAAPDAVAGAVSQFTQSAASQSDKVASSIGSDLAVKAKSLAQAAMDNPSLKAGLSSALQSLASGQDASGLGTLFTQLKDANLTPQQTQLAKEVGNLASAYAAQRNFSSLDGAQGDVSSLVNALRKGEVTSAVTPLQNLAHNASLTGPQKDLLATLADNYAPGLKKASDSLKQGLQAISGISK